MITDALNTFFTPGNTNADFSGVGSGTTVISDVIDTGPLFGTFRDLSRGQPLRLRIQVETAFTSGGAATLTVAYGDSPNADGSAGTVRASPAAVAVANLTLGAIIYDAPLPTNLQRYLYVSATVGTAAMTAGKLRAAIVEDTDSGINYPSATPATGF